MAKDSQMDNKQARKQKNKGQSTMSHGDQNQGRSSKKQSAPHNDV